MKKIHLNMLLLSVVLAAAVLPGCNYFNTDCTKGSGHMITENRKVGDFTKIDVSGDFKVILKQDSSLSLTVYADDNLIKNIETTVEGGKLRIHSHKNMCDNGELTVTIGVHNLEEIKSSGAINVTADGKLNTKDLAFDLAGASKIDLDLNAANVTTTGSGATEMNLKGQASSHTVNFSGIGKLHALDFVVGDYNIESSGASECSVNVLHSLTIHSSGAASVKYRGNPSNITNEKSGALTLEKVN